MFDLKSRLDESEDPYLYYCEEGDKPLEPGRYQAKVTGFIKGVDTICMYFELCNGEFTEEIEAETDNDLSPGSEARRWVENALCLSLEDNEVDLLDALVGEVCEIEVDSFLDRLSVSSVYRASCLEPELEEVLLQEKIASAMREDPFALVERIKQHEKRLRRDFPSLRCSL